MRLISRMPISTWGPLYKGGGIACVEIAFSEEERAALKGEDGSKATASPLSTSSSTRTSPPGKPPKLLTVFSLFLPAQFWDWGVRPEGWRARASTVLNFFPIAKYFGYTKGYGKNMHKIYIPQPNLRNKKVGASLVVQWLRFHAPKAVGLGWIPGQGN